jgi:vacuolar-type H+-ATPase subunit C/Vma6
MSAGCDYANARVRAVRSRLLGRDGIATLLAQPGLQARLDVLKRTDYGAELSAHLARGLDPLAAAERSLRARLIGEIDRIDRHLAGEPERELFRAVLAIGEAWTVKTVLRGVAAGEAPERVFPLLAPTRDLDEAALQELVRPRDVKAVVDLLATWHTPYARPLRDTLPEYAARREILHLEAALDRFLFARALEAARRGGDDGCVVGRVVRTFIDVVNAATLVTQAGHAGLEEFCIPGGLFLSPSRFRRYAALDPPAMRTALAEAGLLAGVIGRHARGALDRTFAAEQVLRQALAETVSRAAREHPLTLATVLAFVVDLEAEVRRIRLVLRGTAFGLPAQELLELIEA